MKSWKRIRQEEENRQELKAIIGSLVWAVVTITVILWLFGG